MNNSKEKRMAARNRVAAGKQPVGVLLMRRRAQQIEFGRLRVGAGLELPVVGLAVAIVLCIVASLCWPAKSPRPAR